jgi:hypothetical protein
VTRDATADLKLRVARRFSAPEWFTTFEFPIYGAVETDDRKDRQIDALAISRVATRGNEVVGIECKTDRADWLRERSTPLKADAWGRLLDRFYVAATPGVVHMDELPPLWGFLETTGSGLRERVAAGLTSKWRENGGADPIPRELWIRVLRRTLGGEGIHPLIAAAYEQGKKEAVASVTEDSKRELRSAQSDLEHLQRRIKEFEKASGLRIEEWAAGRIGEAVKVVLSTRDLIHHTGYSFKNIRDAVDELGEALKAAGWEAKPGED